MANLSLTRVNQKLMQAKILLQGVDEESLTPVHRNSLLEAAAFHLICAHQHYLRELAENYGLKNIIALRNEQDLIAAFEAAKKYAVEAQELQELRKQSASWLSQLQTYYDSLWRTPVRTEPSQSENLISLVDEDSASLPEVDLASVRNWQSEFTALVLRQRETSAEF
ncbi:DUF6586 family protein [Cellvibrio sp.]|uniref:DUF6586 family protein n=1 Tax=Cellvibrio sp. TaxID=1965322 RepID=UPI0039647BDE